MIFNQYLFQSLLFFIVFRRIEAFGTKSLLCSNARNNRICLIAFLRVVHLANTRFVPVFLDTR